MLLEMPTKALVDHLADPPSLSAPVNEALAGISAAAPAAAAQAPAASEQAPDKAPPAAQQAPKAPGEVKVLQRPKASPSDAQAKRAAERAKIEARKAAVAQLPPQPAAPAKERTPPANAKTRLCKFWVQRGMCLLGEKCTYAHGTEDMTERAQERAHAKVTVSAPLAFRPLQAMGACARARPAKEAS